MKSIWFFFAAMIVAVIPSLLLAATTVAATPALEEQGFFTAYSRNWMLGYLFVGAIFYTIDRTWLIKMKGWFLDPSAKPVGFVFGQKASTKVVFAGVISTIETFAFLFFTPWNSHLSVELFLWLADIPMMVIGFGVGALLFPLWAKREKAYKAIDELDEVVAKGMEKAGAKSAPLTPVPLTQPATVASAPAPVTPTIPKEKPEDGIAAVTRGSKR